MITKLKKIEGDLEFMNKKLETVKKHIDKDMKKQLGKLAIAYLASLSNVEREGKE